MGLLEDASHWRSILDQACRRTDHRVVPPSRSRPVVHTLYWGAHRIKPSTFDELGEQARMAFDRHAPDPTAMSVAFGIDEDLAGRLHEPVREKLLQEPVEDLRIDFEDGYGHRPDAEEDETARRVATLVQQAATRQVRPRRVGIRIKALTPALFVRSVKTLETFVTTLAETSQGQLGDFVVTLPKATVAEQLTALDDLLTRLEVRLGLDDRAIGMEFMVEVPSAVFDGEGRLALRGLIEAAGERLLGVHLGVYDYTAAHRIAAHQQAIDHPACHFVRSLISLAAGDAPLTLSAGSTNVLPVGPHPESDDLTEAQVRENRDAVHRGWRLAHDQIREMLARGYYHGWDLHPAQLPARFAATFGFYLAGAEPMAERMKRVLAVGDRATDGAPVADDIATGQALFEFFRQGHGCGALDHEVLTRAGLTPNDLAVGSFAALVGQRANGPR